MSESTDVCTRCEQSLGESPRTIHCSGKALGRLPAEIRLCHHCWNSLAHWLQSKHRFSGNDSDAVPRASASSRRRKRTRRQTIIRTLLVYGGVGLITFLFIYQMLGNALRQVPPSE